MFIDGALTTLLTFALWLRNILSFGTIRNCTTSLNIRDVRRWHCDLYLGVFPDPIRFGYSLVSIRDIDIFIIGNARVEWRWHGK